MRETVNQVAWNVSLPVNRHGVEMFIKEDAKFLQRLLQARLLRGWNLGIRHPQAAQESPEEETFRDAEFLRTCEQEFLGFAHLPLQSGVCLDMCRGHNGYPLAKQ